MYKEITMERIERIYEIIEEKCDPGPEFYKFMQDIEKSINTLHQIKEISDLIKKQKGA